jgi:rhodanese-related sulfurtransferase
MTVTTTVKRLGFDEALEVVSMGGALLDLRPAAAYLESHVPGSIGIVFESGPGMQSRVRDCLPLEIPYALLDLGHGDVAPAAAALRGKGFNVVGAVDDALRHWAAAGRQLASTEVVPDAAPADATLLHVGDPGAVAPEGALSIPAEDLWPRTDELPRDGRIVVVAGYGVRAALCVGILERKGFRDVAVTQAGRGLREIR